jgi:uncharacterized protein
MTRILLLTLIAIAIFLPACIVFQRKLLYYPTHHRDSNGLAKWLHDGRLIGYAREVPSPANVWLMLHGNAGQASDRVYALPSFSGRDALFILEYPGYGERAGSPSMAAINAAAREAYEALRSRFPNTPVCVVAESIGSGPASLLAASPHPPDKIVLIAPFDVLNRVAAHHFPFLPARLLLWDNWDNIEALKGYQGPLQIFAARDDSIIPVAHARALADSKPTASFHVIDGDHNDWATAGRVAIRNP